MIGRSRLRCPVREQEDHLPATTSIPAPPRGPAAYAARLSQAAVLIVDDEQGMRHFLSRALAPRFGRVDAVDSAEAGRDLVAAHRYDLVILDITLPGLSGLAWLRELRAQGHAGEVILITAFADLDTAIEALRAGASDFLLKPFRVAQILNAVQQGMNRSQLARENRVSGHLVGCVHGRGVGGHGDLRCRPGGGGQGTGPVAMSCVSVDPCELCELAN